MEVRGGEGDYIPIATYQLQLHLPTHDLFWAKVRVQLHLPPLRSLDLLISPGTPMEVGGEGDYIPIATPPE